jgi:superfamily I DNA/RNA helicase
VLCVAPAGSGKTTTLVVPPEARPPGRRALERLEASPDLLGRWRAACHQLLVDEAQDLDRSQLDLALLLAAPTNRIFLVGDDDQP